MPQRPRIFPNQQARKAFFQEKQRLEAAARNSNPYMQQPWSQFPSQPAGQAWPPMQATPQPTPNFSQPYMSQEQRMQEYYRFEQASFQRFQYMISPAGQPVYSPFPQPQDPPPSPQSQDPPPPQTQHAPTWFQHPAPATQYQVSPGIHVPFYPSWSGPNNRANVDMEEYIILRSRQAALSDNTISEYGVRIHEIEDKKEDRTEELELKRKAPAEEGDNFKKTKLNRAGHEPVSITTPIMPPPSKPPSQQPTTRASSATSKSPSKSFGSNFATSTSSNSSVGSDVAVRRDREAFNSKNLIRAVKEAKKKLDHATWRAKDSLGDEFACVTKTLIDEFKPPTWYSVQLIIVWRASLSIPSNWIILVQEEVLSRHPVSKDITDIVQVYMENAHYTTTHLSLKKWTVVFYDPYIWKHLSFENEGLMFRSCDRLVKEVRKVFSGLGFKIPDKDPLMSSTCTIEQHDDHSCGPFALREVEILLGLHVQSDLQCPLAIRNRHARTVSSAITNSINIIEGLPFPAGDSDKEEIDKTDFIPKPVLTTNISKTSVTSTRPSPELEFSIIHSNQESTAPSPSQVLGNVDDPQDQEESPIHLKGTRGIPKELISTLNVAQEKPRPRPKPEYHECYRVTLPEDENKDHNTVPEHDDEESDQSVDTGCSESEDAVSLSRIPWPTEEAIANLSVEQKRQAWQTISHGTLKTLCRKHWTANRGRATKRGNRFESKLPCIDYALEQDLPFPPETSWTFLSQSIFEGYSRKQLISVRQKELLNECFRLEISVSRNCNSKEVLADKIQSFIQSKGIRPTIKFRRMRFAQQPRPLETGGRDLVVSLVDLSRPVSFLICTRTSTEGTQTVHNKYEKQRIEAEQALRSGRVVGHLEQATFVHLHLQCFKLDRPILPTDRRSLKEGSADYKFLEELDKVEKGTQIIFVSLDIDGISCNVNGWRALLTQYPFKDEEPEIYILFAESKIQWNSIQWTKSHWAGPIEDRYWAICKLQDLVRPTPKGRLHEEIRDQWERCRKGR